MIPFPTWWGRSERQRSRGTEPGGTECRSGSGPHVGDRSCSCKCHDRGGTSSPEDINKWYKRLLLNAEHICCKTADSYSTVQSHCQDVLRSIAQQSDRIKQCLLDILSVSVPQTRPTELALNPPTLITAATCLSVHCFLTALMTRRALRSKHNEKNMTSSKGKWRLNDQFFLQYQSPNLPQRIRLVQTKLVYKPPRHQ